MSQMQRVTGVATTVYADERGTNVRYHRTDVVSFDSQTVTLRSGGWQTATTKTRMNQASNQFNLGYHVYQKAHAWYVVDGTGQTHDFEDGMVIPRRGRFWNASMGEWVAGNA